MYIKICFLSAKGTEIELVKTNVKAISYICVVQEVLIVVILCGLVQFLVVLGEALSDGVCSVRSTQALPFGLSAARSGTSDTTYAARKTFRPTSSLP